MTGQPPPTADVDSQIKATLRQARRLRWYVLCCLLALLCAAVTALAVITSAQHAQLARTRALVAVQQAELAASCQFWASLAGLPVTVPAHGPPPRLGVSIIAAARTAYAGQRCGPLPPAAPSLVTWAGYYRIPLP